MGVVISFAYLLALVQFLGRPKVSKVQFTLIPLPWLSNTELVFLNFRHETAKFASQPPPRVAHANEFLVADRHFQFQSGHRDIHSFAYLVLSKIQVKCTLIPLPWLSNTELVLLNFRHETAKLAQAACVRHACLRAPCVA